MCIDCDNKVAAVAERSGVDRDTVRNVFETTSRIVAEQETKQAEEVVALLREQGISSPEDLPQTDVVGYVIVSMLRDQSGAEYMDVEGRGLEPAMRIDILNAAIGALKDPHSMGVTEAGTIVGESLFRIELKSGKPE